MILERTGVEPGSLGQAERQSFQTGNSYSGFHPIDCADRHQVAIGEVIQAPGLQPGPESRDSGGTRACPDDEDGLRGVHEKSPALHSGRTRPTFGFRHALVGSRCSTPFGITEVGISSIEGVPTDDGISPIGSVDLLDLLGQGQHQLVALLLASAGHFHLDRLILGGVAEPETLVSIIGQLAGKVVRGLLAVLGDDHDVLALLGVLVLQAALGTKSVTLEGDGLAAIVGSEQTQAGTEHTRGEQCQQLAHRSISLKNNRAKVFENRNEEAMPGDPIASVQESLNHLDCSGTTGFSGISNNSPRTAGGCSEPMWPLSCEVECRGHGGHDAVRYPATRPGRAEILNPVGVPNTNYSTENRKMATDIVMNIGEALAGEGNEVAHIDLLIGKKEGPVGLAFANALANQSAGHTNLLAVLAPNLIAKPATVLITKVTIEGMKQVLQMFGPAQSAVAKAVTDCVAEGTIPATAADDLVIVCGVFIHPAAKNNAKIAKYNYEATKLAIQRAMKNSPAIAEIIEQKDKVEHPFAK